MQVDVGAADGGAKGWQFAVAGGILGWVLDAFDFFVVVFLLGELATKFHVNKQAIVVSLTLTLAMRPVGALLFGSLADRFGRKGPLMICVAYFSLMTVCSGLAPGYGWFLAARALYGIGMGGYWGIGASLRDGVGTPAAAWVSVGHDAGRVPVRLPDGFGRDPDGGAAIWVGGTVLRGQRGRGGDRADHDQGAGIGRVAGEQGARDGWRVRGR